MRTLLLWSLFALITPSCLMLMIVRFGKVTKLFLIRLFQCCFEDTLPRNYIPQKKWQTKRNSSCTSLFNHTRLYLFLHFLSKVYLLTFLNFPSKEAQLLHKHDTRATYYIVPSSTTLYFPFYFITSFLLQS